MNTLKILADDILTLAENDTLQVDQLTTTGTVNGTGTLTTDCLRLSGTVAVTVRRVCYTALTPPELTVTRIAVDSVGYLLEETTGATGYLVQIAADSTFSDPTEIFLADPGPGEIGNLTSGTAYWLRVRVVGGTATSEWSGVQSLTTAVDASGIIAFDAAAVSPTTIRLTFPTVSGAVDIRRRPADSDETWTTVVENDLVSPFDDSGSESVPLTANVCYDYQWRVTGRSWVETDVAWLTRTFSRSVRVGQVVSSETLFYRVTASETEIVKGME